MARIIHTILMAHMPHRKTHSRSESINEGILKSFQNGVKRRQKTKITNLRLSEIVRLFRASPVYHLQNLFRYFFITIRDTHVHSLTHTHTLITTGSKLGSVHNFLVFFILFFTKWLFQEKLFRFVSIWFFSLKLFFFSYVFRCFYRYFLQWKWSEKTEK